MAGGHGGKRSGSGAKPGNQNPRKMKLNGQVAEEAKAKYADLIGDEVINEMTPLEMMLVITKLAFKEGHVNDAFTYASGCAPYLHPRLSSVESKVTVDNKVAEISDDKLDALLAAVENEKTFKGLNGSPLN